jgi:hypothetical protein
VVVGVDEARRQSPPLRRDHPVRRLASGSGDLAELGYSVLLDENVTGKGLGHAVARDD